MATSSTIIVVLLYAALIGFFMFCYWKIFSKAGFNGALSLLLLIPIVNLFVIPYLAFAEWPVHKGAINSDTFS